MRPKVEQIHLPPDESFRLLHWSDNVREVEVLGPAGQKQRLAGAGEEWHFHCQMELTLVSRGSGTRFVGDNITHFQTPELVLLGPNLPHYWHGLHDSSGYAIQFRFQPEHPVWQLRETRILGELWREAQRGIHFTGATVPEIAKLIQSMPSRNGLGRFALFLEVLDLLTTVPRTCRMVLSSKEFLPPGDTNTHHGIQRAINHVFQNFHQEVYLAEVIREAGMSKPTFERQFKKLSGKSFTSFLTEVRLNFAARRLLETKLPVGEIAFAAGFNNLSHFNRTFYRVYKQTPSEFRNAIRAPARS